MPSPSGLDAVDRQWGGLAPGRAYLLVGRAGAGRSALALRTAKATVDAGDSCLVFSPRAPQELVGVGQQVGLDVPAAHRAGTLRVLRIPSAADLAAKGMAGLVKSYRDLVALVAKDRPARVVIEDFTPLVQFETFEAFHEAFSDLVGAFRQHEVTLVLGLGDPANEASRRLLDVVEGLVDGTVRLSTDGSISLSLPAQFPSSDGASVEATAPSEPPAEPTAPLAPEPEPAPEAPAPTDGFTTTFSNAGPPEAPQHSAPATEAEPTPAPEASPIPDPAPSPTPAATGASTLDPPTTEVVPPDAPHPSLLAPPADPFGLDPADELLQQGYLADSRGGGDVAPGPAPGAPPPMPSFAPIGASAPAADPGADFRIALDAAFASRSAGIPFVVVALRVDPAAPEAAYFHAVEAGLRSALRPTDRLLVDAPRKRAAIVLPSSGAEAAQALFGGLQASLRQHLGTDAERVLQSVAAVTVPDGQPFETSAELLSYAFES
ncbi:ATPase domain-containing protein [Rubrivirga sp. IMCC43871]|uniref:ATPase domain-containing protein n=1 Tax=Rubrivirga sp. IMCC43871 TaxID=3391575 RepID=UPI00398F9EC1